MNVSYWATDPCLLTPRVSQLDQPHSVQLMLPSQLLSENSA